MDLSLAGRKAVVCGSTQGIGRACARELALLGADVILLARNEEELRKTRDTLPDKGQSHTYEVADFSRPEQLKAVAESLVTKAKKIDILVNNTGGPPGGPITTARTEEFLQAFSNHLICNHILVQAFLDPMKANKFGRIINIISTSVKQPLKGLGVSNTVRAAVANWAKTLSLELGPFGITVNNVLPGATNTQRLSSLLEAKASKTGQDLDHLTQEMISEIPLGRFADPEEIAAAVAFLASPAAAYITGINLPVDGGRTSSL
jgi:3-oxoacyl-[acyl-carrier protein] reductase